MERHCLPHVSYALRGLIAAAACAAVLLTSFEDEALLAISAVRASEATEAAPRPDWSDEASLFPDLSRPKGERGESDGPELTSATLTATGRVAPAVTGEPQAEACEVESRLRSSLHALFCVWLI